MNVAEIKAKYIGDTGMNVTVEVEALRSSAINFLEEANRMVANQKDRERRKNAGMDVAEDVEWNRRWKKRQADGIKEQRRTIKVALDMLSEVSAILDRADSKIAEVK